MRQLKINKSITPRSEQSLDSGTSMAKKKILEMVE